MIQNKKSEYYKDITNYAKKLENKHKNGQNCEKDLDSA